MTLDTAQVERFRYPIKQEREPALVGRVGGTIISSANLYTAIGGVATGAAGPSMSVEAASEVETAGSR